MKEQTPVIPLKRERSPSLELSFHDKRKSITSGSVHIHPTPPECVKGTPNALQARHKWVRDERQKLTDKGLAITRCFIRDDGMVLDWESTVSVWSDTLLPTSTTAPEATTTAKNGSQMLDSNMPIPRSKAGKPLPDAIIDSEPPPSTVNANEEADRLALELEDMAIEYLSHYAEAFDTDRDSLVHAYAPDASFSYCIHDIIAPGSVAAAFATSSDLRRFAPRKSSRNLLKAQSSRSPSAPSAQNSQEQNRVVQSAQSAHLYRGPTSIVHVLKALGPHRFCAETPSELSFNVVALPLPFATDPTLGGGAGSSPTVFLTSAGDLVELRVGRAHRLSFDQSFILVRSEKIGNDSSNSTSQPNAWPMVAICHQLTVRDVSLRPPPPLP